MGKPADELLSIGDAAELLGVSVDTLRRWEKKGKIQALRSPGGHRYFKRQDLDNLFGTKYERTEKTKRTPKEKKEIKREEKIKPTEVSTKPEPERPKLVVPNYIRTKKVSIYDTLLTTDTPDALAEPKPVPPLAQKESILMPGKSNNTQLPQTQSKTNNYKAILIVAGVIALVSIIVIVTLLSRPTLISPVP